MEEAIESIRTKEKNRRKRRQQWCGLYGYGLYRKMWQTCLYSRVHEPMAAVGLWTAIRKHKKKPEQKIKGSLCADSLKEINERLQKYKIRKPRRYKKHLNNVKHAVDRALLFDDEKELEYVMDVFIPEAWKCC